MTKQKQIVSYRIQQWFSFCRLNDAYYETFIQVKPIDGGIAVRRSSIYIKHNGTKFILKSQFQEIILHYAYISSCQLNGWQTLETSQSISQLGCPLGFVFECIKYYVCVIVHCSSKEVALLGRNLPMDDCFGRFNNRYRLRLPKLEAN